MYAVEYWSFPSTSPQSVTLETQASLMVLNPKAYSVLNQCVAIENHALVNSFSEGVKATVRISCTSKLTV